MKIMKIIKIDTDKLPFEIFKVMMNDDEFRSMSDFNVTAIARIAVEACVVKEGK